MPNRIILIAEGKNSKKWEIEETAQLEHTDGVPVESFSWGAERAPTAAPAIAGISRHAGQHPANGGAVSLIMKMNKTTSQVIYEFMKNGPVKGSLEYHTDEIEGHPVAWKWEFEEAYLTNIGFSQSAGQTTQETFLSYTLDMLNPEVTVLGETSELYKDVAMKNKSS